MEHSVLQTFNIDMIGVGPRNVRAAMSDKQATNNKTEGYVTLDQFCSKFRSVGIHDFPGWTGVSLARHNKFLNSRFDQS